MHLRSPALAEVLRGQSLACEPAKDECDVVFVLFQEPEEDRVGASFQEKAINAAVRACQPRPALAHCELVVPPTEAGGDECTNFATYLGQRSAWQQNQESNVAFYLTGGRGWRALPVFAPRAAARVRAECNLEQGVEYSLARYVTATRGLRWLARLLPDGRRAPAHCATLAARVLRHALGAEGPREAAAAYGPSTLYLELCEAAAHRGVQMGLLEGAPAAADEVVLGVDALLRGPMSFEAVAELGDEKCKAVVRHLTLKALHAQLVGTEVEQRLAQRQLASGVLRWSVLR